MKLIREGFWKFGIGISQGRAGGCCTVPLHALSVEINTAFVTLN